MQCITLHFQDIYRSLWQIFNIVFITNIHNFLRHNIQKPFKIFKNIKGDLNVCL